MAGDWIKFETATPDKPEIWLIAGALNIDPDAVVGKLLRVWGWFDQHTENGNAPSVSKMLLDRLVGVSGFCKCVIESGWMCDEDGVLSLSNFDRHNGETAKTRALTAKRVAKHKANAANGEVTPAPLPKEEKRRSSNTPKSPKVKSVETDIQTFIAQCDEAGEDPIPRTDKIFEYAEGVSLPPEFLTLCWKSFVETRIESGAKQKDWRATFRRCVKGNWEKIWWIAGDGSYQLTTAGKQAQKLQGSQS